MPEVAGPEGLPTMAERQRAAGIESPFRFWDNMENRPLRWLDDWPPPGPLSPVSESWFRFRPTATFDDPLVDAARLVVVLDTSHCDLLRRSGCAIRVAPMGLRSLAVRSVTRARRCAGASRSSRTSWQPDRRSRTCGAGRIEHRRLLASGSSQLLSTPVPPA